VAVDFDFFRNMSALTSATAPIPLGSDVSLDASATPPTWVWCRNLVFGSMAAAYAEYLGAEKIFVGFNAEEAQSYPDNRPGSSWTGSTLSWSGPSPRSAGLPGSEAPLVRMFKPDIVRLGIEVGARWS